jgi:competence ComEA-like helix-hairpin-helix protein
MHLNRQEQVAVLFLGGALLVGTGIAAVDHHDPDRLEDFHVVHAAVDVPPATSEAPPALPPQVISINHATQAELERLPHIGPKTAAAIVAHRQTHGPFVTAEDLTAVKGIGQRTVDRLRPLVTTE